MCERNTRSNSQENLEETAKLRDRALRGERSVIRQRQRAERFHLAEAFVNELEHDGPANLIHLVALSSATRRPIRIWLSPDRVDRIVGGSNLGNFVDVEYHAEDCREDVPGHWSLRNDVDPPRSSENTNDCLFAAVAAQTGTNAIELRAATAAELRKNIRHLAAYINEIASLEKNERTRLMIGGARYVGTTPSAASRILDNSQNSYPSGGRNPGHPRGHASYPEATGPEDSVQNYSRRGMKTGFLSRSDQNRVAHLALSHPAAQRAMNALNQGRDRDAIHIEASQLRGNNGLPMAREYLDGSPASPELPIRRVTLVLAHQEGQAGNPNADVFVITFYPQLN